MLAKTDSVTAKHCSPPTSERAPGMASVSQNGLEADRTSKLDRRSDAIRAGHERGEFSSEAPSDAMSMSAAVSGDC